MSTSTDLGKHCETNRSKIILHQYLMSFNFEDLSEMVFDVIIFAKSYQRYNSTNVIDITQHRSIDLSF